MREVPCFPVLDSFTGLARRIACGSSFTVTYLHYLIKQVASDMDPLFIVHLLGGNIFSLGTRATTTIARAALLFAHLIKIALTLHISSH